MLLSLFKTELNMILVSLLKNGVQYDWHMNTETFEILKCSNIVQCKIVDTTWMHNNLFHLITIN